MPGETTFSQSALTRAWRQAGQESLWLRVQSKAPAQAVLATVAAALAAANDAEWGATGGAVRVLGEGPSSSPGGPIVHISLAETTDLLLAWVSQFAQESSARGLLAKIVPVRPESAPIDFEQSFAITAPLTVPIDESALRPDVDPWGGTGWYVPGDVTATLVSTLVQSCLFAGGEGYLRHRVAQFRIDLTGVEDAVLGALASGPPVKLTVMGGGTDFRRVVFDLRGQVTVARRHAGEVWEDTAAQLELLLTGLAPLLEQGFVRRSAVMTGSWGSAVNGTPPRLPFEDAGLRVGYYTHGRPHLLAEHAVDAYGVQVLTDAHLAHASDLSGWDVRTVAPGRHLVRARDLAPWLDGAEPDPATLARARADFGDLILNPRTAGLE